jgi:hypothetical protein
LSGTGYLGTLFAIENIDHTVVWFIDSYPYPFSVNQFHIPNIGGLTLEPLVQDPYNPNIKELVALTSYGSKIFWPTQGNYYPSLSIFFNNGTVITESYQGLTITVAPLSELETERINQVNEGLSIALVLFALIETISIIQDFLSKKKD